MGSLKPLRRFRCPVFQRLCYPVRLAAQRPGDLLRASKTGLLSISETQPSNALKTLLVSFPKIQLSSFPETQLIRAPEMLRAKSTEIQLSSSPETLLSSIPQDIVMASTPETQLISTTEVPLVLHGSSSAIQPIPAFIGRFADGERGTGVSPH